MKKLILLALCALFALPSPADQVKVGKRTWSFDANADGKSCVVRGVFPANGSISVPAKLGRLVVTRIDPHTFDNPTVTALSVPAGVTSIASYEGNDFWNCFGNCTKLAKIKVAAGNKTFSAKDGVLYDKKKTKVLAVIPGKKGSYKVPASVRTIGEDAFWSSSLSSVTLPKKLTTIEWGAFENAESIKKITIPAFVTFIGGNAFAPQISVLVAKKNKNYSAAGGVLFDKKKTTLIHCPSTKKGVYRVPASVTTIGDDAFAECDGLTKVAMGRNVKTIGNGAFYACRKLKSAGIPAGTVHIGEGAFYGCSALTSFSLPASVATLGWIGTDYDTYGNPFGNSGVKKVKVATGNQAFAVAGGCLVSKDKTYLLAVPPATKGALKIPATVTDLDYSAFLGCDRITSITIPAGMDRVWAEDLSNCGSWNAKTKTSSSSLRSISVAPGNQSYTAVGGVLFSKDKKVLVAYPVGKKGAYKVPASVKEIQYDAFYGVLGVTKITVPDSVEFIGSDAFASCPKLTTVRLPSKLTSISTALFYGDSALQSVSIPSKVSFIGGGAFSDCGKLTSLTVPASVKTIADGAFGSGDRQAGIKKLTLPNKGTCDVPRQDLPASCKVVYRNKSDVYWIRLVSNGGSLSDWDVPYEYLDGYSVTIFAFRNKATALPANPFYNWDASVFVGWATSPNGAAKYNDKASVKNLAAAGRTATLYAKWSYPDDSGDSYGEDDLLYCESVGGGDAMALSAIGPQDDCAPAPGVDASADAAGNGVSFSASGDVPWTDATFADEACFESGAIGDGGTSTLLASVEGAGTLAFRWRTSSEEGRDIAFFSVDGKDVSSRSGLDDDWATVSLRIEGEGPHALSWTYAKDASGSAGDDRARLADVVWFAD